MTGYGTKAIVFFDGKTRNDDRIQPAAAVFLLVLTGLLFLTPTSFAMYSFEDTTPPAGWSSDPASVLSPSTRHFKHQNQSLRWQWSAGSHIRVADPENLSAAAAVSSGGIQVWIYNENPVNDAIVFQMGRESDMLAGTHKYEFTFGLNFSGWRAAWVRFREDAVNDNWGGSEQMDCLYIKAPLSGGGDLYIDMLEFVENVSWARSADFQVAFVNGGECPVNVTHHWQYAYKWSQEPAAPSPGTMTQAQMDAFAMMKQRFMDFLIGVPRDTAISETFNSTVNTRLDYKYPADEQVQVSPHTGYKWGGYNAGRVSEVQFSSGGKLRFRDGSDVAGSYAYMVFAPDTADNPASVSYVPDVAFPAAIRIMVRSTAGAWYISEPVAVTGQLQFDTVQWFALGSGTNSNLNALQGADEQPLSITTAQGSFADCVGSDIDGLGFYIHAEASETGHFTINDIVISGGDESAGLSARKAGLEQLINNGIVKYDNYNISVSNGVITGTPLFAHLDENLPHVAEDFGEGVLFPLALDYKWRGNAASRDKFLVGIDYMRDQGWAEGSAMGTMDHQGNQTAGWMNAVFMMWDEFSPTQQQNLWDDLNWYSEFGEVYRRPFHRPGTTADRFQCIEIPRLMRILLMEDTPAKVRDMQCYRQWLTNAYGPSTGWAGTIKPDHTGWHHLGIQANSYAPPAFHAAALVIYLLSGTEFAVDDAAVGHVTQTLLEYRKFMNTYDNNPGIGGRSGAAGDNAFVSEVPAFALLAHAEGDLAGSALTPVFKRLYDPSHPAMQAYLADASTNAGKMWTQTPKAVALMDELVSQAVAVEASPQGNWTWNWSCLSAHRRDDWMASVKGWTRYSLNYESSGTTNELGWNQSHGGLQIYSAASRLASGYDFESGWDWNRYPGTTAVGLSWTELLAKDTRRFSTKGFGGGLHLENTNGLFALDLYDNLFGLDLRAKKSYFFFDDVIVCLGSAISDTSSLGKTQTTLFQSKVAAGNDIIYNNSAMPRQLPYSDEYSGGSVWLLDAFGNGYYIPDASGLNVAIQNQSSLKPDGLTAVAGSYALAWLDHGVNPSNDEYEYAVKVQTGLSGIQAFAAAPSYQVLRKDDSVHIVKDNSSDTTGYAVFSAVASLTTDYVRQVDAPCLMMIRPTAGNTLKLSLVDPDIHLNDGGNPTQDTGDFLRTEETYFSESQPSVVRVTLNGQWQLASPHPDITRIAQTGEVTSFEFSCKDGRVMEAELIAANTLSFIPTDDTYVESEFPTNINGDLPKLKVRNNAAKLCEAFMKFDVTGVTGRVTSAKLKLKSQDNPIDDTTVSVVYDSGWAEGRLSWNNRPAIGVAVDSINDIQPLTGYEFDLTGYVPADGTYTFALTTTQTMTGLKWDSKETENPPVLELTFDPLGTPAPFFATSPVDKGETAEAFPFSGTVASDVICPDIGSSLVFSRLAGPEWLTMAPDGTISGVPRNENVGENTFYIGVREDSGTHIFEKLTLTVKDTFSGQLGLSDLEGLSLYWLESDCGLCGGADLNMDCRVDMEDFARLGSFWLSEQ